VIRGFFEFFATLPNSLNPITSLQDLKRKFGVLSMTAFLVSKPLTVYFETLLLKKYKIKANFELKSLRASTTSKDPWDVIIPHITKWQTFGFLVPVTEGEECFSSERLTRNNAPFADPPNLHIQEKNVDLTENEVRLITEIRGQGIDDNAIIKVSDLQSLTQFTHLL